MRYINVICALLLTAATYAQTVRLEVAGNLVELEAQQTQSELKPGWKIADVKLKDKVVRYLWGAHATQLTDDRTPTFVITPAAGQVLCDFALMRPLTLLEFQLLWVIPVLLLSDWTGRY